MRSVMIRRIIMPLVVSICTLPAKGDIYTFSGTITGFEEDRSYSTAYEIGDPITYRIEIAFDLQGYYQNHGGPIEYLHDSSIRHYFYAAAVGPLLMTGNPQSFELRAGCNEIRVNSLGVNSYSGKVEVGDGGYDNYVRISSNLPSTDPNSLVHNWRVGDIFNSEENVAYSTTILSQITSNNLKLTSIEPSHPQVVPSPAAMVLALWGIGSTAVLRLVRTTGNRDQPSRPRAAASE